MNQLKFFYIISTLVTAVLFLDSILTPSISTSKHFRIRQGYTSSWTGYEVDTGTFLYAELDEHKLILYGTDANSFKSDSVIYSATPILNTPKAINISDDSKKYTNNFILTNVLTLLCLILWYASLRLPKYQILSVASLSCFFLACYIYFAM